MDRRQSEAVSRLYSRSSGQTDPCPNMHVHGLLVSRRRILTWHSFQGFARTSKWKVAKHSGEDNFAEVTLTLASNEETMKVRHSEVRETYAWLTLSVQIWPHQFSSSYTVRLFPDSLECVWEVENTSKKDPLTFTSALHSYFQVDVWHVFPVRVTLYFPHRSHTVAGCRENHAGRSRELEIFRHDK